MIPGSSVDYNVLVDSVGAANPNINLNVAGYVDLSSVKVLGYSLGRYSLSTDPVVFNAANLFTPFGDATWDYEITNLVGLNSASKQLNDYLSNMMYGVNPDIQFRAWVVLQMHGYMTGTMSLVNISRPSATPTVVAATNFNWTSQYDTQTTRLSIPANAVQSDTFTVEYSNLVYHLQVTPGIKLGVSVLGGIIGFDYTFMIPGVSQYMNHDFSAPNFDDATCAVQSVAFNTDTMTASPTTVPVSTSTVTGSFVIHNTGSTFDNYVVSLLSDLLPAGTTASISTPSSIIGGTQETITYSVNLGPNAHSTDYLLNDLAFQVESASTPSVYSVISQSLVLDPVSSMISTQIVPDDNVSITPGVSTAVPVYIVNKGAIPVNYQISIVGGDSNIGALDTSSFYLNAGESTTANFNVNVPALPTSTPGVHSLSVKVDAMNGGSIIATTSKSVSYTVEPFSLPSIAYNTAQTPQFSVALGSNATDVFDLTNGGNVPETFTVAAVVDQGTAYINNVIGSTDVVVSPGSTTPVWVVLAGMNPGDHDFNVTASAGGSVVYSHEFFAKVSEFRTTCTSQKYAYTNSPLTYTITVYNQGSSADTINVDIKGLDSSAYTINSQNVFVPAGTAVPITMTISPSSLTKVSGGLNGIEVGIYSQNYNYTDENVLSVVSMPVLSTALVSTKTIVENGNFILFNFPLTNNGNIKNTYTIVISGVDLQPVIYVTGLTTTSDSNNTIVLLPGQTVQVSIAFPKAHDGLFFPNVQILDYQGIAVQSLSGSFAIGLFYTNLTWIILAMGVVIAAAIVAFVVYRRRNMNSVMTDAERKERKESRILSHKSEKLASKDIKNEPRVSDGGWKDADKVTLKDTQKPSKTMTLAEKRRERSEIKEKAQDKKFWE
jgi:hypothetical protein